MDISTHNEPVRRVRSKSDAPSYNSKSVINSPEINTNQQSKEEFDLTPIPILAEEPSKKKDLKSKISSKFSWKRSKNKKLSTSSGSSDSIKLSPLHQSPIIGGDQSPEKVSLRHTIDEKPKTPSPQVAKRKRSITSKDFKKLLLKESLSTPSLGNSIQVKPRGATIVDDTPPDFSCTPFFPSPPPFSPFHSPFHLTYISFSLPSPLGYFPYSLLFFSPPFSTVLPTPPSYPPFPSLFPYSSSHFSLSPTSPFPFPPYLFSFTYTFSFIPVFPFSFVLVYPSFLPSFLPITLLLPSFAAPIHFYLI